ncbi:2-C-methyl-D-erythritol 2,4-cyclodiphosphate synthase, partial [Salmonella enterica subsp. enterica serovar Kentucky]|nr:2-C-methyl-D-erythritol 2,4-cyclodiphosphate synthase [Salmonella enterica subsp. enterica serovar Kentucky]
PKMLPHIPQMRVFIAEDLGCHLDDVNVKATTTEKLGFTGRGESIACAIMVTSTLPRVYPFA